MNRTKSSQRSNWFFAGGVVLIALVVIGGSLWLQPAAAKLEMDAIARQTVKENEVLKITPVVQVKGAAANTLKYAIISGPPGAKINSKTGLFTWKPSEDQGPETYKVELGVTITGTKTPQASRKFSIEVQEVNEAPAILDVVDQTVGAGETLNVVLRATDHDIPKQELDFRFGKVTPKGARLDPKTGAFEWTAPESSDEHDETAEIIVAELGEKGALKTEVKFKIHVKSLASAADRLAVTLKEAGLAVETAVGEAPEGFTGNRKALEISGQTVTILEYETPAAADADMKQVSKDGQKLFGQPHQWSAKTHLYHADKLIVIYSGVEPKILAALEQRLKSPVITAEANRPEVMTEKPAVVEISVSEKMGQELAALLKDKKLLKVKEYPTIRKLFARQFEEQRAETLKPFFEGDGAELHKWFEAHPDLQEEFYIAVTPEDDLAKALQILAELHKKFPRKFQDYFALAIATAVTWDNEQGIYDFSNECKRTHANYPENLLTATENFQYFVDTEKVMEGRAQFLPWEFLTHLINHRTAKDEREWALENYGSNRVGFGKCYSQVPYDYEMLRTESKVCKLDSQDYTLPNLVKFGGVCSQQGDFASRVGKSIGVPAEYVTGQGRFGGYHAWVMWVEVKQVTKTGIDFSLESHGRYFDDNYYVGNITDPQTGKEITDRQLELRLHAIGMNPLAYRQTNLIMSAYPQLREAMKWNTNEELKFLNEVTEMSPGNEQAWQAVARLARDGKIETASFRLMNVMFGKLFTTFGKFPDFTWTVFDDLVTFQKNKKQRNHLFEQLVEMYEAAARPDLACEARLRLTDYLLEESKTQDAIAGLAFTIKKFPDEGQFVPKLLDKLESVAGKGSEAAVLEFYQELITLIPPKRGNSVSTYYLQMLGRASEKFKAAGQLQQAQVYAELARSLKAAGK
jgi:hypothetical protein